MTLAAEVFPEDTVVDMETLQTHGLLDGDLSRLNVHLVPRGWRLDLMRDREQVLGVVRRRMSPDVRGGTNDNVDKGRKRHHSNDG